MSRYIEAATLKVSILRYAETLLSHKRLPITKRVAEEVINDVCFAIDVQKTEDVVPVVHGHWIQADLDYDFVTCSNCKELKIKGRKAYRKDYAKELHYCPLCGAKMDENNSSMQRNASNALNVLGALYEVTE